jgi:hypothetical protein
MNEKTISSQLKYECSFLKLYEDEVKLDQGKTAKGSSCNIQVEHLYSPSLNQDRLF